MGEGGAIGVFWGCRALSGDIPFELSTRAVLKALEAHVEDVQDQACCGEPLRSMSISASCYMAIRTLAISANQGFSELLIPCSKGYYMARWAQKMLSYSAELREQVRKALETEGLDIKTLARPVSLLEILNWLGGPDGLKGACRRPMNMRIAVHPGCYLLRAGTREEGYEALGTILAFLKAIGAEAPYYPGLTDCCGGTLEATRPDAALALAGAKLVAVSEAGLEGLVVICPACFEMLDNRQEEALAAVGGKKPVPVLYLTQLLGLALGLEPRELGLDFNRSPVEELIG